MKIAFISYEFPPDTGKGGIGTYVKQTAAAMAAVGMDVHVFAGSQQRACTITEEGYQVHLTNCTDVHDFRLRVVDSFTVVQELSPFDLIESAEINGNAWEIKKKYPLLPLIVRLHAPGYLVESLKKRYIPFWAKLRFVAGSLKKLKPDLGYWRKYHKENDPDYQFTLLAEYITAPSESMKEWAVENWELDATRINVIPNIFLAPESLLKNTVSKDALFKTVLFFGRLNVLKGLVNASLAMKQILREYPDWKFTVIGDDGEGPYAKVSMRVWMNEKLIPVKGQVEFLAGMKYELLLDAVANADIVLLPSLFESFSYTCAEAMAAGKAIVGSKNGGMAMLIENNKSGLLVDPESTEEIYAAVKKLIADNDKRYQLALSARKRILSNFDPHHTVAAFSSYYKTLLN
jgi:glycosyltransferase involved in cell wall biosynthesis